MTRGYLLLLVSLAGCAGYQIGNQGLYPQHIRTVYVPVVESNSFRRNLGERLTEAVAKRIEAVTPYKVVGSPDAADSILSTRIYREGKNVVIGRNSGEPREVEVDMQIEVSWMDAQSDMIRYGKADACPSQIAAITAEGDLIAEVGHSVATAQQQAIDRLADQIVGLMEAPW